MFMSTNYKKIRGRFPCQIAVHTPSLLEHLLITALQQRTLIPNQIKQKTNHITTILKEDVLWDWNHPLALSLSPLWLLLLADDLAASSASI
jgi:hypothetical protein